MRTASELTAALTGGGMDFILTELYPPEKLPSQRERWLSLLQDFRESFGDGPAFLFSAPGRIEIGGNHTDHNRGRVLAAAVHLDIAAVARPREDGLVRLRSDGFPPLELSLHGLEPVPSERGSTASLIRGTAAYLKRAGYPVGGFEASLHSMVPVGSGLSSSAAFEVLTGSLQSCFYGGGGVPPETLAAAGQYAESVYFGKPSGPMDQTASAVGGLVAIDFYDTAAPSIERLQNNLASSGLSVCVVDTRGSHADLGDEYAAIPGEMGEVARALGAEALRYADENALLARLPELREALGDRAVLRALHFFEENRRVEEQRDSLERGDIPRFLRLVNASGDSSFQYLQNLYVPSRPREQGLPLAVCLARRLLGEEGACRVHGGGFAGTTLNFLPRSLLPRFTGLMEAAFGPGCVIPLSVRSRGAGPLMGDTQQPDRR